MKCNFFLQFYKKLFPLYFSFGMGSYYYNGKWATNKSNCSDPKKLFESITFKYEDVILRTFYSFWNHTFGENIKPWHQIDHWNFGHCFTLDISEDHAHFSFVTIYLQVKSTIFFHTSGMFQKLQMEIQKRHQSIISLGNEYKFNFNYEYWEYHSNPVQYRYELTYEGLDDGLVDDNIVIKIQCEVTSITVNKIISGQDSFLIFSKDDKMFF